MQFLNVLMGFVKIKCVVDVSSYWNRCIDSIPTCFRDKLDGSR